jgi:hypothetical protein
MAPAEIRGVVLLALPVLYSMPMVLSLWHVSIGGGVAGGGSCSRQSPVAHGHDGQHIWHIRGSLDWWPQAPRGGVFRFLGPQSSRALRVKKAV